FDGRVGGRALLLDVDLHLLRARRAWRLLRVLLMARAEHACALRRPAALGQALSARRDRDDEGLSVARPVQGHLPPDGSGRRILQRLHQARAGVVSLTYSSTTRSIFGVGLPSAAWS